MEINKEAEVKICEYSLMESSQFMQEIFDKRVKGGVVPTVIFSRGEVEKIMRETINITIRNTLKEVFS